jgi:anti-sigma factor RsiW
MTGEHRKLRENLGVYALGVLTGRERDTVQSHLAACPRCRNELAELTPVVRLLASVSRDRFR